MRLLFLLRNLLGSKRRDFTRMAHLVDSHIRPRTYQQHPKNNRSENPNAAAASDDAAPDDEPHDLRVAK
jgi:hypothetical protein